MINLFALKSLILNFTSTRGFLTITYYLSPTRGIRSLLFGRRAKNDLFCHGIFVNKEEKRGAEMQRVFNVICLTFFVRLRANNVATFYLAT